ncbi:Protein goliath [Araneus ventricosus]|uniref:Protein goliath n=1 Tax=Araneus ventricosus TaxID=182803 RepID=A0A4Y2KR82_ARAVE|nr:Protein goliath [Araneus ventricosus]
MALCHQIMHQCHNAGSVGVEPYGVHSSNSVALKSESIIVTQPRHSLQNLPSHRRSSHFTTSLLHRSTILDTFKEILSRRLCSAAKKALDKIPVKTVKSDDSEHDDEYECCAICIEPFQHGELIRSLPCKHCFHKICIDPWLLEQRSCPMCKLDILLHFGLVYTGSQESVLEIDDDDFFRPRQSLTEHDIVLVQNQRRHSSVRVAISRREDRATSPCSLSSLNPDAVVEQSFVSATVDMSDVAVNTSDPPSEADYESSEERWTSPFPKKFQTLTKTGSQESVASQCDTTVINTEEENYEICDLTFEN